jgi:hypothetical protein
MDATVEAGPSSLCSGVDADICEDFNRGSLDGDPFWSDAALGCVPLMNNGNAVVRFYGQYLDTRLPNSANVDVACYLQSVTEPAAPSWTLDFDLTSAFFAGGPRTYLTIARVDFNYDSGVEGGLLYQSFLLQVSNDNVAKLVEVEQRVGMPATEEAPIADTNGLAFLTGDAASPMTSCHIKIILEVSAAQLSSAVSTCPDPNTGKPVYVDTYVDAHGAPLFSSDGDGGPAVLFLGFDDESANVAAKSELLYDNVILRPYQAP